MLTLEQCLNFKKWGLPQTSHDFSGGAGSVPYTICCPDLEQLLEFAATKWPSIGVSRYNEKWYATGYEKFYKDKYADPDPKQAIYKLLEQIIEPNNKKEESENG